MDCEGVIVPHVAEDTDVLVYTTIQDVTTSRQYYL